MSQLLSECCYVGHGITHSRPNSIKWTPRAIERDLNVYSLNMALVHTRWRTRCITFFQTNFRMEWVPSGNHVSVSLPLSTCWGGEGAEFWYTARGRSERTAVEVRVLFMTRRTPWIKRKGMDLTTFHFCYILVVLITGMFFSFFFTAPQVNVTQFVVIFLKYR